MTSAHLKYLLKHFPYTVREHRCEDDPEAEARSGVKRPVKIGSRKFESMKRAAKAMHVSVHTIQRWLDDGRATYA